MTMKATKTGKCVVCHTTVTEVREFLPQTSLLDPVPKGITAEMSKAMIAWRDVPILCADDAKEYEVRIVARKPAAAPLEQVTLI